MNSTYLSIVLQLSPAHTKYSPSTVDALHVAFRKIGAAIKALGYENTELILACDNEVVAEDARRFIDEYHTILTEVNNVKIVSSKKPSKHASVMMMGVNAAIGDRIILVDDWFGIDLIDFQAMLSSDKHCELFYLDTLSDVPTLHRKVLSCYRKSNIVQDVDKTTRGADIEIVAASVTRQSLNSVTSAQDQIYDIFTQLLVSGYNEKLSLISSHTITVTFPHRYSFYDTTAILLFATKYGALKHVYDIVTVVVAFTTVVRDTAIILGVPKFLLYILFIGVFFVSITTFNLLSLYVIAPLAYVFYVGIQQILAQSNRKSLTGVTQIDSYDMREKH